MATRYYFRNTTPSLGYSPPVAINMSPPSPYSFRNDHYLTSTLGGGQDSVSGAYPCDMSTTPGSSNTTIGMVITEPNTNPHFGWVKSFVSPPLKAQTLTGTISFVADFQEGNAAQNMYPMLGISVVTSAGALRGYIYHVGATGEGYISTTEANTTIGTTQTFVFSSYTLSDLAISAGDRIVVNIGFEDANSKTADYNHYFGLNGADASGYDSYIEFSMNIAEQLASLQLNQGITVTAPKSGWPKPSPSKYVRRLANSGSNIAGSGANITISELNDVANKYRLKKKLKKKMIHNSSVSGNQVTFRGSKYKRLFPQGVSVGEANSGAVARLKKKFKMTFGNNAARPKQGISVTAPASGWPKVKKNWFKRLTQSLLVAAGPAITTFRPTALGANSWTDAANAYLDDLVYATCQPAAGGTVEGLWKTCGITDHGGTITKVELGAKYKVSDNWHDSTLTTGISWDAGANWSPDYADTSNPTTDFYFWTDVTSATDWTWSKLNDTNLLLWVKAGRTVAGSLTFYLDVIDVRVTYNIGLKKKFVMRFTAQNAGRPQQGLTVGASPLKGLRRKLSQGVKFTATYRQAGNILKRIVQLLHVGSVPSREKESFETYALGTTSITGWTTTNCGYEVKNALTPPDGTQYLYIYPTSNVRNSGSTYHALKETVSAGNPYRFKFWITGSEFTSSGLSVNFLNNGSGNIQVNINFSSSGITISDGAGYQVLSTTKPSTSSWYALFLELNRDTNTWRCALGENSMPEYPTNTGAYWQNDDTDELELNPEYKYEYDIDDFQQLDLGDTEGPKLIKKFSKFIKQRLRAVASAPKPVILATDLEDIYGFHGNAVENGDDIYVAFQGKNLATYVTKFDGTEWLDPVFVADTNVPGDAHGAPGITRSADGYLHVWFGNHDSLVSYYASDNPDDISSWSDVKRARMRLQCTSSSYSLPFVDPNTGKMFYFFRDASFANPNLNWTYITSVDNGLTWVTEGYQWLQETERYAYLAYIGHYLTQVGGHSCVNLGWVYHMLDSGYRENFYYARLDMTDLHFYSIDGTDLGTEITPAEADSKCLVFDSGGLRCYFGSTTFSTGGTPLAVINYEYSAGLYRYISLEWNGSSWTNQRTICSSTDYDSNTGIAGALFTTSGGKTYLLIAPDHTNVQTWEYDWTGKVWLRKTDYADKQDCPNGTYWGNVCLQPTSTKMWLYTTLISTPRSLAIGMVGGDGSFVFPPPLTKINMIRRLYAALVNNWGPTGAGSGVTTSLSLNANIIKKFVMRFGSNAGRPKQGINITAPVSGWPKLRGLFKRTVQQGMTVSEANSGAVARLKKRFVMTFKNATTGASRGRQSISITDNYRRVSRWKRTFAESISLSELNTGAIARLKKRFVMRFGSSAGRPKQGISVTAPVSGWPKFRGIFKRTFQQGMTVSEINTGAIARLRKRFVMTFKNATAGASRGRQGVTITAPVSGWPKFIARRIQRIIENFGGVGKHGVEDVYQSFRRSKWKRLFSQGISVSELNTGAIARLKKKFVMRFTTQNAGRPRQGINVTAPTSGWPKFTGRWKRTFAQGVDVKETNSGAVARLKKRFIMTFKSTTGSRGRQSITVTAPASGWPKLITRRVAKLIQGMTISELNTGAIARLRKRFVMTFKSTTGSRGRQSVTITDNLSTRSRWKRTITQAFSISELNTGAIARVRKRILMTFKNATTGASRGRQSINVTDSLSLRASKWKRFFSQGISVSELNTGAVARLKKKFVMTFKSTTGSRGRQTINITDNLSNRGSKWKRYFSQAISVSELNTGAVARLKKKFVMTFKNATAGASRGRQGISVSDTPFKRFKKKIIHSAKVVDSALSVSKLGGLVKVVIEAFKIADRLVKRAKRRMPSQGVGVSAVLKRLLFKKKVIHSAKVSDNFLSTRGSRWKRYFPQSINLSAIISKRRFGRRITQGATFSAVISRRKFWKDIAHSLYLTATMSRRKFWRKLTQGATFSAIVSRRKFWKRLSQTAKVVDTYLSTRGTKWKRAFQQALKVTGTERMRFGKRITQGATLSAVIAKRKLVRKLIQAFNIVATISTKGSKWIRKFTQSATFSAVISKRKFWKRISQGFKATDSYTSRGSKWVRKFAQSVTLSAVIARKRFYKDISQGVRATASFISRAVSTIKLIQWATFSALIARRRFIKDISHGLTVTASISRRTFKRKMSQALSFAMAPFKRFKKDISQSARVIDTSISTRASKWVRKFTQALSATANLVKKPKKKMTDGTTVSATIRRRGILRKIAQAISLTATITKRKFWKRIIQSAKIVDSVRTILLGALTRQVIENIHISATVAMMGSRWKRMFSQSVKVTDNLEKTLRRKLVDSFKIIGTLSKRGVVRRISQGITLSAIRRRFVLARKFYQGFSLNATTEKSLNRRLSQSAKVVANYLSRAIFRKSLTQGVKVADSFRYVAKMVRKYTQGIRVTDILTLKGRFVRRLTEVLKVAGTIRDKFIKKISQPIATSALAFPILGGVIKKVVEQAVKVADNLRKKFKRPTTGSMTLSATVLKREKKFVRQPFNLTDNFRRGVSKWVRKFTQSITLTASIRKQFRRKFSQSVFITGNILKRTKRVFAQGLTASANVFKRGKKVVRQTISVLDSFTTRGSKWVRKFSQGIRITDNVQTFFKGILRLTAFLKFNATAEKSFKKISTQPIATSATIRKRARRAFYEALRVTDSLRKRFWRRIPQGVTVVASHLSRATRRVRQGITILASKRWILVKRLSQSAKVVDTFLSTRGSRWMRKFSQSLFITTNLSRMNFWKRIRQSAVITATVQLTGRLTVLISQALKVSASVLKKFAMKRSQGVPVADRVVKRFKRIFTTPIKVTASVTNRTRWLRKLVQNVLVSPAIRFKIWKRIRQSITVVANIAWKSRFVKRLSSGLRITAAPLKRFRRVFVQSVTVTPNLLKRLRQKLRQAVTIGDRLVKRVKKSLSAPINVTDRLIKRLKRVISESATVTDNMGAFGKWIAIYITDKIRFAESIVKNVGKRIAQGFKVVDFNITEVTFQIVAITPLAGTFPRPARIATLSLRVTRASTKEPLSGCIVTVAIKKPDGTAWKTLNLTESTHTPGLYSSNFRIYGSDPIGSYPFVASATYSKNTGTYSGFITIFQGPLAAIHFR